MSVFELPVNHIIKITQCGLLGCWFITFELDSLYQGVVIISVFNFYLLSI